jgi:hypothetical protein
MHGSAVAVKAVYRAAANAGQGGLAADDNFNRTMCVSLSLGCRVWT